MKHLISSFLGLLLASQLFAQDIPANWTKGGTWAGSFSLFSDKLEVAEGKQSLRLSSKSNEIYGSGTIEQEFDAGSYRGKTLRFTAKIKAKNLKYWASIFISIDNQPDANSWTTEGDTYKSDEKIAGNSNWIELVMERRVPFDAKKIKIGLVQYGSGTSWIDDMNLEAFEIPIPEYKGKKAVPENMKAELSNFLDTTKIGGYKVIEQEVVFSFDPLEPQQTTSMWKDGTSGLSEVKKIKYVVLASQLNNWNSHDKRYRMIEKDGKWEIRVPLKYFPIDQSTEFKFVVNGDIWIEPKTDAVNQTKAGNWTYSNNYFFVYPGYR